VGTRLLSKAWQLKSRLRACLAMLVLLPGWFGAPVSLFARAVDVCTMPCCVRDGHCCCKTRHARVKGHPFPDTAGITTSAFSNSCPQGCNSNVISFQTVSAGLHKSVPPSIHLIRPANPLYRSQICLAEILWAYPSIGRSPPDSI
jgi:hypothetical protein